MPKTKTVEQIVAVADEARRALFDLELELQKEIDGLRFVAFKENRPLTAAEKDLRNQLRASQGEIRDSHAELAYVTLARLDNSEEVKLLKQRIDEVNHNLKDDLETLAKIQRLAVKVANVADQVAKIVKEVATKAASLGI